MTIALKPFVGDVSWLHQALTDLGHPELSLSILNTDCWPTLSPKYWSWPDDVQEALTQAMIRCGNPDHLFDYCEFINDREDVWRALVETNCGTTCGLYCGAVRDRDEMRKVLIENGDAYDLLGYCTDVSDRDDVREAMIAKGDDYVCSIYRKRFGKDATIKQEEAPHV